MGGVISNSLVAALAALLLTAAIGDLRTRTIPNWLNGAVALLAIGWWWANGWSLWPDVALQIGIALVVFLIFAGLFALGAMGGGDVKLIAALALWLPLVPLARMLMAMALLGGALTLGMLIRHRWVRAEGRPEIPYGVAIAAASLWVFANDLLTIFGS
jgi:prepilin peptidase CpaA